MRGYREKNSIYAYGYMNTSDAKCSIRQKKKKVNHVVEDNQ